MISQGQRSLKILKELADLLFFCDRYLNEINDLSYKCSIIEKYLQNSTFNVLCRNLKALTKYK